MAQVAHPHQRELTTIKVLLGFAILAALVALAAGLVMIIAEPESGSTTEAAIGLTAAAAGILTGVLAVVAAIYAQVKNLWQYAPMWVRVVAWAAIAFAVVSSLWRATG